jgi:hypothetical protein
MKFNRGVDRKMVTFSILKIAGGVFKKAETRHLNDVKREHAAFKRQEVGT